MNDFIHIIKYSFNARKNKITYALLFSAAFLALLFSPVSKIINSEIYSILLCAFFFFTAYSLHSNELNLGKSKLNQKDNFNTSLLYHFSLLQRPRILVYANLAEIIFESLILSIYILYFDASFKAYLKTVPIIFPFWFLIKSSYFLFKSKRFNYFISTNHLNKISVLNITLLIIATSLALNFIIHSKFDLFSYIEREYFLGILAAFMSFLFFFSAIYNLENDNTPKLITNQKTLIISIFYLLISFVLSDPFYNIYRQDQYIFSLISNDDYVKIDQYLKMNPKHLNVLNNYSSTPLIKALNDKRKSETILAILNHKPKLEAVRKLDNKNALMLAVENCQIPVIKKLIELGIDVNFKDQNDQTALFSMHRNDCFEAFPILKNNGIKLDSTDKNKFDFKSYGLKFNTRFRENYHELNEIYHFE